MSEDEHDEVGIVHELADNAIDGLAGSVWKGTGVIEVVRSGSLPRVVELDFDLVVSRVQASTLQPFSMQTGCKHSPDAVDQIDFMVLSSAFAPPSACPLPHEVSTAAANMVLGETS